MEQNERRIIDDLFERLRKAEEQSAPRDPEAESLIARHVAGQPAAPYYMAQAIVVQQDALARAHARIEELERRLAERRSGGFLGGLFGAGEEAQVPAAPGRRDQGGARGFERYQRAGGGSFLAGAMQTALGVAGGFLIADAIAGLLSPDEAAASTADDAAPGEAEAVPPEDADLAGEETGGDFDFGGFDEL
jgi:hypothetical protein